MATNSIYCDHRHELSFTNQFHIIYWIAPMIAAIFIPLVLTALYWQIPLEVDAYGFTTKLKSIIAIMCIGIVLSTHALTAYAIQWKSHFPTFVASIQQIDCRTINIVSYRGEEKRYNLPVDIREVLEEIKDPGWLRIYWYSTYKNRYIATLIVGDDVWLISKQDFDSQEALRKLQPSKTSAISH